MFVHGKNSYFQLDSSAGALVTLSTYMNSTDFEEKLDTPETTTYGKSAKTFIAGLTDGSCSIGGLWDPTLDAHMTALMAALAAGTLASATFVFGPQGSTAGQRKYTGECFVTNFKLSDPVGGVITWSATLQASDAITATTF